MTYETTLVRQAINRARDRRYDAEAFAAFEAGILRAREHTDVCELIRAIKEWEAHPTPPPGSDSTA